MLLQLYPRGRKQYVASFAEQTDAAIEAGFLLEADRQEVNALAAASFPAT